MNTAENELKIIVHHVGGRGWNSPFRVPKSFADDVAYVYYEADPEGADELLKAAEEQPFETYVIPYGLWSKSGPQQLNITANSYASSILTPDVSFFDNRCEIDIGRMTYDVTYDDMLNVVRRVEIEARSLNDLAGQGLFPYGRGPDFISLDTQGAELEILRGASDLIGDVLGICTEIEFQPMYQGQPLAGDILSATHAWGFDFASFIDMYFISNKHVPIGWRGRQQPGFGDALFFQRISRLSQSGLTDEQKFIKLNKLAFIAVSNGHTDIAVAAIFSAEAIGDLVSESLKSELFNQKYGRFIEDMRTLLLNDPQIFPPSLGIPKANHATPDKASESWYDLHHSDAVSGINSAHGQHDKTQRPHILKRVLRRLMRSAPIISHNISTPNSFEALLRDNDFHDVADTVASRRNKVTSILETLPPKMRETI